MCNKCYLLTQLLLIHTKASTSWWAGSYSCICLVRTQCYTQEYEGAGGQYRAGDEQYMNQIQHKRWGKRLDVKNQLNQDKREIREWILKCTHYLKAPIWTHKVCFGAFSHSFLNCFLFLLSKAVKPNQDSIKKTGSYHHDWPNLIRSEKHWILKSSHRTRSIVRLPQTSSDSVWSWKSIWWKYTDIMCHQPQRRGRLGCWSLDELVAAQVWDV